MPCWIARSLAGRRGRHRETQRLRKLAGTRFQQLSAPVAAKAVEDTAFYRYGRLLSRNDVGFDAGRLALSIDSFHARQRRTAGGFPGRDAGDGNARPQARRGSARPPGGDQRGAGGVGNLRAPVPGAERRTLPTGRPGRRDHAVSDDRRRLAAGTPTRTGIGEFAERLAGWQQKALREAKLRTDWTEPHEDYETTARDFLQRLFEPESGFLELARPFIELIAPAGAVNGLSQAVLKMTVPGMPDFFQGTEFWDFSLVDPDNRRPVDYDRRRAALAAGVAAPSLLDTWRDGGIKQALIHAVLDLRRQAEPLFARGSYHAPDGRWTVGRPVHCLRPDGYVVRPGRRGSAAGARPAAPRRPVAVGRRCPAAPHPAPTPDLHSRSARNVFGGALTTQTELQLDTLLAHFPVAVLHISKSA